MSDETVAMPGQRIHALDLVRSLALLVGIERATFLGALLNGRRYPRKAGPA